MRHFYLKCKIIENQSPTFVKLSNGCCLSSVQFCHIQIYFYIQVCIKHTYIILYTYMCIVESKLYDNLFCVQSWRWQSQNRLHTWVDQRQVHTYIVLFVTRFCEKEGEFSRKFTLFDISKDRRKIQSLIKGERVSYKIQELICELNAQRKNRLNRHYKKIFK